MDTYKVTYQVLRKGSNPAGTSSTTIGASSVSEARQKFNASHAPTSTTTYKVLAVVKT